MWFSLILALGWFGIALSLIWKTIHKFNLLDLSLAIVTFLVAVMYAAEAWGLGLKQGKRRWIDNGW